MYIIVYSSDRLKLQAWEKSFQVSVGVNVNAEMWIVGF
jgi:hypothetical protein